MSVIIYTGRSAIEGYQLQLVSTSGMDLSLVTAAVLRVRSPRGVESTWPVAITGQTPSLLTLTHMFDGTLTEAGIYAAFAELTVTDGIECSKPYLIHVHNKFSP